MRTTTTAMIFVISLVVSFSNVTAQTHCIDFENMDELLYWGTIRDISSLHLLPGVSYEDSIDGVHVIDAYENQTVAMETVSNLGNNGFVSQVCPSDKLDVAAEFMIREFSDNSFGVVLDWPIAIGFSKNNPALPVENWQTIQLFVSSRTREFYLFVSVHTEEGESTNYYNVINLGIDAKPMVWYSMELSVEIINGTTQIYTALYYPDPERDELLYEGQFEVDGVIELDSLIAMDGEISPNSTTPNSVLMNSFCSNLLLDTFGDITYERMVDSLDLQHQFFSFGYCENCPSDLSGNGFVNIYDMFLWSMNMGSIEDSQCEQTKEHVRSFTSVGSVLKKGDPRGFEVAQFVLPVDG